MTCEYEDDFSDYLTVYRKEGNEELVADVIDGIGFWRDIPGISRAPGLGPCPTKNAEPCVVVRRYSTFNIHLSIQRVAKR